MTPATAWQHLVSAEDVLLQKDVWLWCSSVCSHGSPLMAFTCWKPYRPFFGGHFGGYCVSITHLAHHLGRQCSLLARHLCLHVKGHVSLGICVTSACLTYPRLWGRCICWVQLCCGCSAGAEALVQMVRRLSCSGGTVLVGEDQTVRDLYVDDWCNMSYFRSKTDAVNLFHQWWCGCRPTPTNLSILLSTLPLSWLHWDLSPGAMCTPAVQSITGLKWPWGTWGWGSKAPDSEYENLFLIFFEVTVGLRAAEQCSAAGKQLIWQLKIKKQKNKTNKKLKWEKRKR